MKLFLLLTLFIGTSFATPLSVPTLPSSPFADAEATTNLPLRIVAPGRDWRFDFQMSCMAASNTVQLAFGVDADGDGELAAEETRLVVGRDAVCAFVENPLLGERFEQTFAASGPRVGFGAHIFLRSAGRPSRFLATNEVGAAAFDDWRTNPPAVLFDPAWNLVRATVRGPTVAAEHASVSIGPDGQVLVFR